MSKRDYAKTGYDFLDCEKGQWRNDKGEVLYLCKMDNDYLVNCYKFLDNHKIKGGRYSVRDAQDMKTIADKLVEIDDELKARGITP